MQWKVANSLLGDAAETVVCIHMYKALGLVNDVKAVNKKKLVAIQAAFPTILFWGFCYDYVIKWI